MLGEPLDRRRRCRARCAERLQREPFVEHQRIVREAVVEGGERRLALGRRRATPGRRARPGGRSCCRPRRTAPWRAPAPSRGSPAREQAERDGAQPARALGGRAEDRRRLAPSRRSARQQLVASARADRRAQRLARAMDRVGVDHVHPVADHALARQQDRLGLERRVERVGPQACCATASTTGSASTGSPRAPAISVSSISSCIAS